MTERKATDILLDLEKINLDIQARLQNLEFQFSLIVNKLNSSSNEKKISKVSFPEPPLSQKKTINEPVVQSVFTNPPDLKSKIAAAKKAAEEKINLKNSEESIDFIEEPQLESNSKSKKKNENLTSRTIPVYQKLEWSDGKPVFMAAVEIKSGQELVKKTKTNQLGKWFASLPQGSYLVCVKKAASQINPAVELEYSVEVPEQDSTVVLETKQVE